MDHKKIIITGRGKLAEKILKDLPVHLLHPGETQVIPYTSNRVPDKDSIFIHVGSGKEYRETLALAFEYGCPYIQAATEKSYPLPHPEPGIIPFIHAPNLDLTIIKFLQWLKLGKDLFTKEPKRIKESHQSEKTSIPGTARKICELLGIDPGTIQSIRDPNQQKKLPVKNIDHHAYHEIMIGNTDSYIRLETNVTGLSSYVEGLSSLISCLSSLEKKNYEIEELVSMGVLDRN